MCMCMCMCMCRQFFGDSILLSFRRCVYSIGAYVCVCVCMGEEVVLETRY